MKAISIKNPYAGLIIAGIKNVENRSWVPAKSLGTIAICSTAKPDARKWWQHMRDRCTALGVKFPEALCKINGAVLGTVVFNYVVWTDGDMPPAIYLPMHPSARLTNAEKQQLITGLRNSLP